MRTLSSRGALLLPDENGVALDELRLRRSQTANALEVLGTFADRCHHGKEEQVLFPALERRGLSRTVGPMAVMLNEHERARAIIARMREALAADEGGQARAASRFAIDVYEYTSLMREHIGKEDDVLFPIGESLLRDEDREQVLQAFGRAESEELGTGTHERMLELVDQLSRELGVSERTPRDRVPACECRHDRCHG